MRGPIADRGERGAGLGSSLVVLALIAVSALVVVGLVGVVSGADRPDAIDARPSTVPVVPTPAAREARERGKTHVAFVDLRDGSKTPLPTALRRMVDARRFSVSPDGRTFAFEAVADDAQRQIFLARVDGHGIRQLTDVPRGVRLGGWSPDGRTLALVTSDTGYQPGRVAVIDVRGGHLRRLTASGYVFAPGFAADGRAVLYSLATEARPEAWRTDLWSAPVNGDRPTRVVAFGALGASSPDGRTIAYHRTAIIRDAFCGNCWWYDLRIAWIPSDGSEQPGQALGGTIAPPTVFETLLPRWSPDGSRVLVGEPGLGRPIPFHVRPEGAGDGRVVASGSDATWFDDQTLIVVDMRKVGT